MMQEDTSPSSPQPDVASLPVPRRIALRSIAVTAAGLMVVPGVLLSVAGCKAPARRGEHVAARTSPRRNRNVPEVKEYPPLTTREVNSQPAERLSSQQTTISVHPRSSWAKGKPVPKLMNRMKPVKRITVHHDGMDTFTSTSWADCSARIELIRTSHRNRGWGDIGYHYVVDPAGRVWQGRPLTWQGAHVGNQNENNLGICVLGNYEQQSPTPAQRAALEAILAGCMVKYRVPLKEVRTHREMASTACPGRNLQRMLDGSRSSRGMLAAV